MEYSFSSKNMTLNVKDKVPYLTYNRLSHIDFITHGFSTKYGGVSTGEFTSMNLAFIVATILKMFWKIIVCLHKLSE